MAGEITRDGLHKNLVPFLVDRGCAADVAREGTVIDEMREGCLRESR